MYAIELKEELVDALMDAQYDEDMDRLTALLTAEGLTVADWDAWCVERDRPEDDGDEWHWEDPWDE